MGKLSELNRKRGDTKKLTLPELLKIETKKAKENSYVNSIWLADVKGFYKRYNINLGYKRKHNAPPRKNRPAIIIDKEEGKYSLVFLTTSKYGGSPFFDVEYCNYKACPKYFDWNGKSKVLVIHKKGKKPKKVFKIEEKDLHDLMTFCGTCSDVYIYTIKQKIFGEKSNV